MKAQQQLLIHCPGCGAIRPLVSGTDVQPCPDCGCMISTAGVNTAEMQAKLRQMATTRQVHAEVTTLRYHLERISTLLGILVFLAVFSIILSGCELWLSLDTK